MFFGQFSKMMLVLAAVAMLGLGCKKATTPAQPTADAGPPVADGGTNVPEGWQVHRDVAGGYEIAYPPGWRVTEDGVLYKDAPNLKQLLAESNGHFESVAQVAPASIGIAVFDLEGKSVDQLWEEAGGRGGDIDRAMTIGSEPARLGICTGIRYMECISVLHAGMAYSINMYDQGLVNGDPSTRAEIEQIVNTFNFLP